MDFTALHQGVILAVSFVAGATFSIPSMTPQDEVSLAHPQIISSYNLPSETVTEAEPLQNLNSLTQPVTDKLELIVKEAKADEVVVTVDQPPVVFTVAQPTPKPSPSALPEEEKPDAAEEKTDSNKIAETKEKSKIEEKKKPSPSPSASPSVTPSATLTSSNADILFQMTNEHRAKIGKQSFEKDDRLCKIAGGRALQVNSELAGGTLHKGFKALNLPYWATENLAAYQTMKENFNFLVTDYIHRVAIESDHKYSCTACSGTSCSQIFSSFQPK